MNNLFFEIARTHDMSEKRQLHYIQKTNYGQNIKSISDLTTIKNSPDFISQLFVIKAFLQDGEIMYKTLYNKKFENIKVMDMKKSQFELNETIVKETQLLLQELPLNKQQEYKSFFDGIIKFDEAFMSISEKIGQSSNIFFHLENEIDTSQIPNDCVHHIDTIQSKLTIINDQINYNYLCQNIICVFPQLQKQLLFTLQLKNNQTYVLTSDQISKNQQLSKIVLNLLGSSFLFTQKDQ